MNDLRYLIVRSMIALGQIQNREGVGRSTLTGSVAKRPGSYDKYFQPGGENGDSPTSGASPWRAASAGQMVHQRISA